MAFTQKLLTAQISIQNGQFQGGGNTLNVSGLRMSVSITTASADGQTFLEDCTIYGLRLSDMNKLTLVGAQFATSGARPKNTIVIQAGDAESGMTTVFEGTIITAWIEASGEPQVCFRLTGNYQHVGLKKPVPVTTQAGVVDGASLAQQLAGQMGFTFENGGVSVKLSNPYLHGTAISQMRQLADALGCQWMIDRKTLAIWPAGGSRPGSPTLVSKDTGMVGYPTFQQAALVVKTLFNPAIKPGGQIQVKSQIEAACGIWTVNKIRYELDTLTPRGRWFQEIYATIKGAT